MLKVTRKYTVRTGRTIIPMMLVPHLEYYFLLSLPHLKNTGDIEEFFKMFLKNTREQ